MFGKNQIVGQKFFKDAEDKLFITSRFVTLQGEGPFRGQPAFFVRFAKCNLACSFCDTYFDGGDWYTIDEIEKDISSEINKYFGGIDCIPKWAKSYKITHFNDHIDIDKKKREMVLVITGGEPMLQKNIVPFLERMNKQFTHTQIESNGLIWQDLPIETTLVVSPKCSEKKGNAVKYLEPNDKVLARADCLKFVMSADLNSPYSSIPNWALEWKDLTGKEIFISPMNIYNREPEKAKQLRSTKNDISIAERSNVDEVISFWEPGLLNMEQNQKNHEYSARFCMKYGLTLNLQVHLFASLA